MERFRERRPSRPYRGFGGPGPPSQGLFEEYASAYWRAAQKLLAIRQDDNLEASVPNTEDFPIIELYRHALELAIKALLTEFPPQPGILESLSKAGHNFRKLFEVLDQLKAAEPGAFNHARYVGSGWSALLDLIEAWDKREQMFRYGVQKSGDLTLPDEDFRLDVVILTEQMDRAIEYVWAVRDQLVRDVIAAEVGVEGNS